MKPLIIANWKARPETLLEAKRLFAKVNRALPKGTYAVICPPQPFLATLAASYRGRSLSFGVQDISSEISGSHTGESTALMLASAGASYAIIGHSERRAKGEDSAIVGKKLKLAIAAKLTPVLCIGEHERDLEGRYLKALEAELRASVAGLSPREVKKLILAYEPIWAIGKDSEDAITPASLHETILFLRKILSEIVGRRAALAIPVLYGGSVTPENARALRSEGHAGGFLVGHESLEPARFAEILRTA